MRKLFLFATVQSSLILQRDKILVGYQAVSTTVLTKAVAVVRKLKAAVAFASKRSDGVLTRSVATDSWLLSTLVDIFNDNITLDQLTMT